MVITDGSSFKEESRSASGEVTSSASDMVRALRQAGFPVTVVSEGDERAVAAMATRAGPDHVVAVSSNDVHGLERPVVVYVDGGGGSNQGRLHIISRATASLLWVRRPAR
jgi:phosphoserine phosphatase